jgi:CubicO group peptidase (beta-lactamase class C family)
MSTSSTPALRYTPPKGEWERRDPGTLGFDPAALSEALKFAEATEIEWPRDLHDRAPKGEKHPNDRALGPLKERSTPAGLVIRGGYIVGEYGYPSSVEITFSCTKSYISTLTGQAVDRGLINNMNDRVAGYIDDGDFSSDHNSQITWRHLLQQTNEWEGELFGLPDMIDRGRIISTGAQMDAGHDDGPLPRQESGTYWEYNDVRVNRTALSLLRLYEESLPAVLKRNFMDPIGASDGWQWHGYETSKVDLNGEQVESVSGGAHWGGGLWIDTYDHARFGLLYSRRGRWGDNQIVSEAWIDAMTEPCPIKPEYGYLWWLNHEGSICDLGSPKSFAARGAGGNLVFIEPERDIVIVLRWSNDTKAVLDRILGALAE